MAKMPCEYIEALWGKVVKDELHICAFMPIKHTAKPTEISYKEYDYSDHEDEAIEHRLEMIGSIHTHPQCLDEIFSETDLRGVQDEPDIIMGICSITQEMCKGKMRKSCCIAYWPCPRPMKVIYTTRG